MFMRIMAAIAAALGVTLGGFALHSAAHLNTGLRTSTAGRSNLSSTASGASGIQPQTAALIGTSAQLSAGGEAHQTVVPAVVTTVSGNTVTISPLSASSWSRAGLSADQTLTIPVSLSASVLGVQIDLSAVHVGSDVVARVQGGVVDSLQASSAAAVNKN